MAMKTIFLVACCVRLSFCSSKRFTNKYRLDHAARLIPDRMLRLMEEYQEDAWRRMQELNELRFTYEETPQYELGYITGEIFERYRKMVETVKRPMQMKSYSLFDHIKRTELNQNLYFEVYHLVNMAHEILRKYQQSSKLHQDIQPDFENPIIYKKQVAENEREKNRIKMDKIAKKKNSKVMDRFKKEKKKKVYNNWWPNDYGWEIDYYW
ncbi:hypothetical protein ACJJTC_001692 [Scirpophaga incertulas]